MAVTVNELTETFAAEVYGIDLPPRSAFLFEALPPIVSIDFHPFLTPLVDLSWIVRRPSHKRPVVLR
jgi:hypothetical protein